MKYQSTGAIFAFSFFLILLNSLGCSASGNQTGVSTIRETNHGSVAGFIDSMGAQVWLGIPYAQPPVGSLRWRAPQPPTSWSGVRPALTAGPKCVQYEGYHTQRLHLEGSEDCLYLNIWAPPLESDNDIDTKKNQQRFPVMMWIHGGGGVSGEGSIYDGAKMAVSQNVVLVTINYRLGYFGRFTHPSLRAVMKNEQDRSGNYSTLDQIQALQWIRENIAAFGGDPNNVTVFGESAGGRAVVSLLLSPIAKGKFDKAIIQSGKENFASIQEMDGLPQKSNSQFPYSSHAILINLLINDKKAKSQKYALELINRMSNEDIFSYLHRKSPEEFLRAHEMIAQGGNQEKTFRPMFYLSSIIDGKVIPTGEIKRRGDLNEVPIIIGSNKNEQITFLMSDPLFSYEKGKLESDAKVNKTDLFSLAGEYFDQLWRALSVDELAEKIIKISPNKVFSYRLDWDVYLTQLAEAGRSPYQTPHGADLAFLFGKELCYVCPRGEPKSTSREHGFMRLSEAIMSYWANFAATGHPGKGRNGNLPYWGPWGGVNENSRNFLSLDDPENGGLQMLSGTISKTQVLDKLKKDDRLPSVAEKCVFLELLLNHQFLMGLLKPGDYHSFLGGSCEYPGSRNISIQE